MEFYINDGEKSCNLVVMIVGKEMGEWSVNNGEFELGCISVGCQEKK